MMRITNKTRSIHYKNNLGFTLLEVLIAVLVLAIGLLGLAGLQTTGLKNNLSAYHRSQATQLSYDIADRMRANTDALSSYTTITPTAATKKAACESAATGCNAAAMAEHDLYEWNTALEAVLPSGVGTVATAGTEYKITITWNDDRDGDNSNNASFETSMQP